MVMEDSLKPSLCFRHLTFPVEKFETIHFHILGPYYQGMFLAAFN